MDEINKSLPSPVLVRQIKYLNNIVEQDHRAVERVTRPVLGFKLFNVHPHGPEALIPQAPED